MTTNIYISFIREHKTGVDFTTVTRAPEGYHLVIKEQMGQKYNPQDYTVLTTFTTTELDTMLDDIHRWCGILPAVAPTRTTAGQRPLRYSA